MFVTMTSILFVAAFAFANGGGGGSDGVGMFRGRGRRMAFGVHSPRCGRCDGGVTDGIVILA